MTPPPPSIGKMYVAANTASRIVRFKMGDSGDVVPGATITSSSIISPGNLFLDEVNDRLYVSGLLNHEIIVINNVSTRNQNTLPDRDIVGAATTLNAPTNLVLDRGRDLLYLLEGSNRILVFGPASTITGNVPPLKTLTFSFVAGNFALDPGNDRLFVADLSNAAIAVFDGASNLSGAVTANRSIGGTASQIASTGPVALDSSGRLLVFSRLTTVLVFSNPGAISGNVPPSAASLLPFFPTEVAISPAGDLYMVNGAEVDVFPNIATATGPLVPIRTIAGPDTGLTGPPAATVGIIGIAIDPTR